jgi:type III secretion protein J
MTWTIMLKNSDIFHQATTVLNALGYPKTQFQTIGQVFQKSGLVSSPLEERARFMYALSENIADTLNQIPGVLSSRVHIVLPENDPYSDGDVEASAAVFLTYKSGGNLDESVREIKYLVANSVQGLDYDRVSLAMFPVAFDSGASMDNIADSNVNVFGLKMAGDAAPKFLMITVGLVVLSLCLAGASIFFFFETRKLKKSSSVAISQPSAPVVVQSDEVDVNALDEAPIDPTEKEK